MKNRLTSIAVSLALFVVLPAHAQSTSKSSPKTVDSLVGGILDDLHEYMDKHWHKGEYNHILNLGKIAIAIDPTDKDVYANSGWLLWSMDREQEAVDLYLKGVKAMPKSYYMYDELGFYYMQHKKDMPTAIKYYEQAANCKDVGTITLHMLANCYEKTNQSDKALKIWQRAAENPADGIAKARVQRLQKKQ